LVYTIPVNPQSEPPPIPVRLERYEESPRRPAATWLHPASALVILGIDWLFFAEEVATFETTLPIACLLAFVSTTAGVFWVQRRKAGDPFRKALLKALFGGFIAGLPTSVAGTILGTFVLVLAGIRGGRKQP